MDDYFLKGSESQSGAQSNDEREPVTQKASESDSNTLAIVGTLAAARSQRERRFKRLVSEWKDQRNGYSSDPLELAMCVPYQKIMAMGPEVVPLILRELEQQPDHWFWALNMLTDSNPICPEHAGYFNEMVNDWLQWGRENGFLRA